MDPKHKSCRAREVELILDGLKDLGWSYAKLHRESKVDQHTLCKLKNGSGPITINQAAKLAMTISSALAVRGKELFN